MNHFWNQRKFFSCHCTSNLAWWSNLYRHWTRKETVSSTCVWNFSPSQRKNSKLVYSMDFRYDNCWMIQPLSVQCNQQNWMHGMHLQRWWTIFVVIPKLRITNYWWATCFKLSRCLGAIWVWKYTSCIAMWIILLTILVQWTRSKEKDSIRTLNW